MRNSFVKYLVDKTNSGEAERAVLLTGDLGYSVLEPLREQWNDRFINAGVAEALMTTLAAAIAADGFKVFTYSIMPFATFRCLEQIRNDVCYHGLDVTVVGIGAGFAYGALGPTHHSTEDLAAMWALPNLTVYCPADLREAQACFEAAWKSTGPKYLRLGKGGEGQLSSPADVDGSAPVWEYQKGSTVTFVSTGTILKEVLQAAKNVPDAQVLSCPFLKPFPADAILERITSKRVLVVEELNPYGAFGSQLAREALKRGQDGIQWDFVSAADGFAKTVGGMELQREHAGVSAATIRSAAMKLIQDLL